MLIDCDTCVVREIHCADCVVSVLFARPGAALELDTAEQTALAALADGGLAPPLRLVQGAVPDLTTSPPGDIGDVRHVAG